jgi:hypothetical protein
MPKPHNAPRGAETTSTFSLPHARLGVDRPNLERANRWATVREMTNASSGSGRAPRQCDPSVTLV